MPGSARGIREVVREVVRRPTERPLAEFCASGPLLNNGLEAQYCSLCTVGQTSVCSGLQPALPSNAKPAGRRTEVRRRLKPAPPKSTETLAK
jgi:hypothetical protein